MEKKIIEKVLKGIDEKKIIELCRDIVKIPSVSRQETKLALFLAKYLEKLGIEAELQEVGESKQVVGRIHGKHKGPNLMFNGHIDHVWLETGWKRDPYGGEIEDGWLYGIGTTNMKGGIAAMISAVDAINNSNLDLGGNIILACVAQECVGGLGTRHLVSKGITADYAIVAEATDLAIVTRHVGTDWIRINTVGESAHYASRSVSGKYMGVNAIRKMMKIIDALGPDMIPIKPGGWLTFDPKHGWEGLPMLNVGVIDGGRGSECDKRFPSHMADFCSILIDFRLIPGQSRESIVNNLKGLISKLKAEDPELKAEIEPAKPFERPPFFTSPEELIVKSSAKWHEYVTGKKPKYDPSGGAYPYGGTDAAFLSKAGTKCVVYGPGEHFKKTTEERIKISSVITASKIFALTAADICDARL